MNNLILLIALFFTSFSCQAPCEQFEVKLVPLDPLLCECFDSNQSLLAVQTPQFSGAFYPFTVDSDGNFVSTYLGGILEPLLMVGFRLILFDNPDCKEVKCHRYNVYHRKLGDAIWNLQNQIICVNTGTMAYPDWTYILQWATLQDDGQGGCNFVPDPTYLWNPINQQLPANMEECGLNCYNLQEAKCN